MLTNGTLRGRNFPAQPAKIYNLRNCCGPQTRITPDVYLTNPEDLHQLQWKPWSSMPICKCPLRTKFQYLQQLQEGRQDRTIVCQLSEEPSFTFCNDCNCDRRSGALPIGPNFIPRTGCKSVRRTEAPYTQGLLPRCRMIQFHTPQALSR